MIRILTDSTSDLSNDITQDLGIESIPMFIQINGAAYRDGEEIDALELFTWVDRTGLYPTTSAPSPQDFINFFTEKAPAIYIGVSSKLSSTFSNAKLALNQMGNPAVALIDSLSFSTGYGQTVIQAAKWRNEGMGFDALVENVSQMVRRTRGIFILDSLQYLYHGGRCKAIEHFVASVLKIRPFLQILPEGTLGILQKVRGSRIRAVRALRDFFFEQLSRHDIQRIFITHLDCDEEAEFLSREIQLRAPEVEINLARVGCVLATHSGPKPLGIAYEIS